MTIQSLARRCLVTLTLAAATFTAAQAQPSAAGTVTPPVRADIALGGTVLATRNVADHLACQSECQRTPGCTGYSFDRAAKANCTLLGGALADVAIRGAVSCRMPCVAPTLATRPFKGVLPVNPSVELKTPPPALPARMAPLLTAKPTPTPPAAPKAAPTPAPVPAPATAAPSGLSGYEIVAGPLVDVAPLSIAATAAQCPAGKVALSAGVDFNAAGDASFGLEVRGAAPDGDRLAKVSVRNANVGVTARVRALAVCVNAIAGLRAPYFGPGTLSAGSGAVRGTGGCNTGERLVGGGVMGREQTSVAANGPQGGASDATLWHLAVQAASPVALPGSVGAEGRVLCVPQAAADGWELIETPAVSLGARSQTTLTLACPAGKALLAAGVVQRSNNFLDMVASNLLPSADGRVSARVHNRNTLGTNGNVQAVLAALCARRQ